MMTSAPILVYIPVNAENKEFGASSLFGGGLWEPPEWAGEMGQAGKPTKPPDHMPLGHCRHWGSVLPGPAGSQPGAVPLCSRKQIFTHQFLSIWSLLGYASILSLKLPWSGGNPGQTRQESTEAGGPFTGNVCVCVWGGGSPPNLVSFVCSPSFCF